MVNATNERRVRVRIQTSVSRLGMEFLFSFSDTLSWIPAYMIFAIMECAAAIWLYPIALESQGRLLQRRERRILEIVTTKTE